MIQEFVDKFMENKPKIRKALKDKEPEDYIDLVKIMVENLKGAIEYYDMDPDRIHLIDDGHYQGTFVFVIARTGYQPHKYWATLVAYGSCSGCDTFQSISDYRSGPLTEGQIDDYVNLILHMVQDLREI